MTRTRVTEAQLTAVVDAVNEAMDRAVKEKGDGALASTGELRGILDEEVEEVHDAIRAEDETNLRAELLDVAVAAIWGLASMEAWRAQATAES